MNRLSVKVSAPRMDGSSVWSVGGLIVTAGRLSRTVGGEYFSSLVGAAPCRVTLRSTDFEQVLTSWPFLCGGDFRVISG